MAIIARWTDFLPDAQGLIERRTSPLASVLVFTVVALVAALVAWMALAQVEQVVRAEGQVEPEGRAKLINHAQGGKVAEILVREGDHVAAGDVLVRFDPELRLGERADLTARLVIARATGARLQAEADAAAAIAFPDQVRAVRPDLIAAESRLMAARIAALANEKQALAERIEAKTAETRAAAADIARLRTSARLQAAQLAAVRELAAKELYPRMKLIAVEQQVAETDGQLAKAEQGLATARAELEEAKSRLTGLDRDRHAAVLAELATVRAEAEQLARQLETQDALVRGLVVTAPVAGTVQELQVSAIGQSVAANQPMMKLIPSDAGLVVEARVRNEDVGHVREGMPVRLKVHAFDFVRFGALEGRIDKIASDARRDQPDAAPAYSVTIVTTGADHAGRGPVPRIQAGMLVDAEIEIGRRTVLSYFTDRLRRIGDEAFSEM